MDKPGFEPKFFIARKAELNALHKTLKTVENQKKPRFVFIEGDYGLGKTTLVEQFISEASVEHPDLIVARGKCAIETQTTGLMPFNQILTSLSKNKGVQPSFNSWLKFIKEVAPAWLDVFTAGVGSAAIETISKGIKLFSGDASFSPENVIIQFAKILEKITENKLCLLFLDDFHWADDSSINLLNHLAFNFTKNPVLFIITHRPVETNSSGLSSDAFRKISANLDAHQLVQKLTLVKGIPTADYIAKRYSNNNFDEKFKQSVHNLTEGHPLFISQLFSLWEQNKLISNRIQQDGDSRWELTGQLDPDREMGLMDHAEVLESVGKIIEERIHLLEPALTNLLTIAAVQGEFFSAQSLADLLDLDPSLVFDYLEKLEGVYRLIEYDSAWTQQMNEAIHDYYHFNPRFIRQIIYQHISPGKQRLLHHRIAEHIKNSAVLLDASAAELASHFEQARDLKQAAIYFLSAARYEHVNGRYAESERLCLKSLSLLEGLPEDAEIQLVKLDLLELSAKDNQKIGNEQEALNLYIAALHQAQFCQVEPERLAMLHGLIADCSRLVNKTHDAILHTEWGKLILRQNHVPFGATYLALDVRDAFMGDMDSLLMAQTLRKLLEYAELLPQEPYLLHVIGRASCWLGNVLAYIGSYTESEKAYSRANGIAKSLKDVSLEIDSSINLSELFAELGDLQKTHEWVQKAEKLANQVGSMIDISFAHDVRGILCLRTGDYSQALVEMQQAITISNQYKLDWNVNTMNSNLALAYLGLGQLKEAEQTVQKPLDDFDLQHAKSDVNFSLDENIEYGLAQSVMGQVLAAQSRHKQAVEHFIKAIDMLDKAHHRHYLAEAKLAYAETLLALGRVEESDNTLQSARELFDHIGLPCKQISALKK